MGTLQKTQSPIDEVVYLASLCSDPLAVDPILDKMRQITARVSNPNDLTPEDHATLLDIRKKLEDYLVTQEPVRSFAPEELSNMIYEHFQGKHRLARLRKMMGTIFLAMVVVLSISLTLPIGTMGYRFGFGITNALAVCLLGAAMLYLTALRSFRKELRGAFIFIAAAIGVSVTTVGLRTLMSSIDHEGASGADLWWIGLLYPFVSGMHLIGLSKYAGAIGLKSIIANPIFLVGLSLIALVIGFLPHAASPLPDWTLKLVLGATWLVILYATCAALLALRIRQKVSRLYRTPLSWFSLSLATTAIASALTFTVHFFFPHVGGSVNGIIAMLYVPSTIFLFISGYAFNRIEHY